MGIPETDPSVVLNHAARKIVIRNRFITFSRSPDSGSLFYKRNSNPQIGGHA